MDNSIQAQGKDPLRSNSAYLSIAEAAKDVLTEYERLKENNPYKSNS